MSNKHETLSDIESHLEAYKRDSLTYQWIVQNPYDGYVQILGGLCLVVILFFLSKMFPPSCF